MSRGQASLGLRNQRVTCVLLVNPNSVQSIEYVGAVSIRKHLQSSLPYGIYHKLGDIAHRNWEAETFGTWDEEGTFYLNHDAGFFSNCSVTLFEIARAKQLTTQVDASNSFSWHKSSSTEDVWGKFFTLPILRQPSSYGYWGKTLLHHNRYSMLNFQVIKPLLNSYFHPSDLVLSRQIELIKKYEIDLSKILTVNYRGTDKVKEVSSTPVDDWVSLTKTKLATLHPATRVLIQTDQKQVRDRFIEEFKGKVLYFEELPVTLGTKVIHEILEIDKRDSFAIDFFAATLIAANSHSVITHTGNVAFWTVLFRGNTFEVVQI